MNSQNRKECYRSLFLKKKKTLKINILTLLSSPLCNLSPNPFVISSFKMSTRFPPASPSPLTHTQSMLIYSCWDCWKGPQRGSPFLSPRHQSHTAYNWQKKVSKLVLLICHSDHFKKSLQLPSGLSFKPSSYSTPPSPLPGLSSQNSVI